jgi:type IV secretory pathway VirB4 component
MMPDEKLKETVHQLEPVIGPQAKMLWYKYLNAKTPERKEAWRRRIKILAEKVLDNYADEIRLPPPTPEQTSGDYQLGLVIYPDKPYSVFGLREEEFCKHVMITGMTGTGKTTAALQIIKELKKHDKRFLVFDWQQEYKKLRKLEQFKDLKVLRVGKDSTFRFNPLIPPKGTDVEEWLAKLVDVINHAYLGSYGTEYVLRGSIIKAYQQMKTLEGSNEFPTFKLVKQHLKKNFFRGRMEMWNQTGMRILESLTYEGGLGQVLNAEAKTNLKELLKNDVIIELDALSSDDKKFLTEALLLWIYEFRKNQGETPDLRHAIIIEEAHNILSKKKEKTEGGETIMETTLRMIRKFGEAVIVIDQEPSKLSESIKANTNTKITFTLGNGKDIFDMATSMEISQEQRKSIDLLKVGHAVVKVKGRVESPIMVYFPKFENNTHEVRENETGGVSLGSEAEE